MKKDRNCSSPYPVYPDYQGMGPIYGMPMIGPNMMPGPIMPMPQSMMQPVTQTGTSQPTYNSYDQQINNLDNQIKSLEKRVSNLENIINNSNSISSNYNSSNYQML